jgi:Meiotically up-regulated gene 113
VIYENGTESNLLLRSLARELYKDSAGRRILGPRDQALDDMYTVIGDDEHRGSVYVLRSRSERADIRSIENLFKIGFSTVPVEERIANAVREPTYLMARVSIVAVYKCFNLNPQKFEALLHAFFGRSCLDIKVLDSDGRLHSPREWFIAPLDAIDIAVRMLVNGEIVHYRYDGDLQDVVER